ncbi:DinB family protein [Flavobacterium sp.]|uniref:DinB family protein n=1 Tax=Flavobacterium sp. TaxID=239 RepID=UPI0011FF1D1F|nr:DinB family protein [Flavobacterium sp.]RZJ68932.1 MAG: DinB family protein [Flavobacterium sp.]
MLLDAIKDNFAELSRMIKQLSLKEYCRPWPELHAASIGEHVRHILEMYQCLEKAYFSGEIEYDKRERDLALQTQPDVALKVISELAKRLGRTNKTMYLNTILNETELRIPTNFERELLYNLEHSIHHQALIKVGLRQLDMEIEDGFGIAQSTLAYRNQCAQ